MNWFIIALISSFFSAFAAIAQKKVLFNRSPLEFSFLLAIVNLVFSLPFFFAVDYTTINLSNLSILFVKSLIGVAAFLCVMTALKNLQISNALPLLALTPGFVAIFAFFLLGESLKATEIIGLLSLITGTYILESKNLGEILFPLRVFFRSKYHRYVLAALLLFTASSIMAVSDSPLLRMASSISINPFSFIENIFIFAIFYRRIMSGARLFYFPISPSSY